MPPLRERSFVVEDGVTGSNRDAAEGGDGLAIELLDAEEDVGFVHRLEIEVGTDDTVAVDNRAAHVGTDLGSVRGLDGTGTDGLSREFVDGPDQEVDKVGRGHAGELGDVDVRDTDDVTPVSEDITNLPLEVIAVGLVGVARGVGYRPLTHVAVLEAGDLALGEGCVSGIVAPDLEPDARIRTGCTTTIEDVVGGLGTGGGLGGVSRGQPSEPLWVHELVPVDHCRGDLLGHAFKEGLDFGESELCGVAVEISDILVNNRIRLKITARIHNLSRGAFCIRHTLIEQAPSGLGEAGSDGGLMSGREIPLDDHHVLEDFVRLGKELDNAGDLVPVIESLGPVCVRQRDVADGSHELGFPIAWLKKGALATWQRLRMVAPYVRTGIDPP